VSLRGLLVLIALLAVAIAAVSWIDDHGTPKVETPADAPLLAPFTRDALAAVDLTCAGAAVRLEHEPSGGWRITQPFPAEADPRRVDEIISGLQDARARKVIAERAAELSAFGLGPAVCEVTITPAAGQAPLALRVGRASPVGSERYATADGRRVVFVDGSLYTVLSRGAEALREKRLFPVDPDAVTRVAIARPDGMLTLVKDQDGWRVEAPFADRAATSACSGLARTLATMEIASAAPNPASSAVRADRRIEVQVTTTAAATPRRAYVAAAGIDRTRLAWREGGGLSGLVAEPQAHELEAPADSFRDLRIASFSTPDARRVGVTAGSGTLEVSRSGEAASWTGVAGGAPFPVDAARLDRFLDRLRELTASGILGTPPGSAPTATITVAGAGRELARLTFGPAAPASGSGDETIWVTTPERPGVVFTLAAATLGPVPVKAVDLAAASQP